ncbi:hypothetical protein PMZ80_004309 [Knufia obscura]|uniref:Uncharacterized protein n=1 Tax=Knufia obscura TaxID=1635080 RepID=A0ABR0RRR4_9EURO|nr:hypothetical protein PMZ80_004309 [Knufia obscura]
MEKVPSQTDIETPSASNNIRIPQGLLQSANSGFYAYSRRHLEDENQETQPLEHIIQQPAQAVLAVNPVPRSRTPDLGTDGRPQVGLGRVTSTRSQRPTRKTSSFVRSSGSIRRPLDESGLLPREPQRRERASSFDVGALLRRQRRWTEGPRSSILIEYNRPLYYAQATVHPPEHREPSQARALSPTESLAEGGHKASSEQPAIRWPGAWSPTTVSGRLSIYQPREAEREHQRHASFLSGQDAITVRRPTYQGDAPQTSALRKASVAVGNALSKLVPQARRSSIRNTFEKAKLRQQQLQRTKPVQILFQYFIYLILAAFVYFVLVGRPLWGGTVWYVYILFEYHLTIVGGSAIFIGLATFYAFGPLLVLFERPEPMPAPPLEPQPKDEKPHFPPAPFIRCFGSPMPSDAPADAEKQPEPQKHDAAIETALLIPCYKSAKLLPATLDAATRVFPATSIFVLANGNSPTPLDETEEVCTRYGVNHVWIPVGSKIVAQYVGAYVAKSFPYALLIDDDCLLPPNFPIVTDRLKGRVKCLGYTITSIGEGRSRGTLCQQAQDLEYKLSGLQRLFAGKIGSATFPHGAIVLWDTEFLIQTFKKHPGFSVSEDWFFGHVARENGSRITMASSIFVETETPSSLFFASGGARGGFGEMTVFKQRFKRWNFFFVNGCYYNFAYILFSWRLGFWEVGAKLFVFQEIYETLLYLITPFVLPISFIVRPGYTAILFAATFGLYFLNSMIFNEVHLRLASRKEDGKQQKWWQERNMMVNRWMLIFYYMPFKFALTFVNVVSCWWSLWQYAKYFSKRHPKIIEDEKAVGVVLKIEEDQEAAEALALQNVAEEDEDEDEDDGVTRHDYTNDGGATKSTLQRWNARRQARHRASPELLRSQTSQSMSSQTSANSIDRTGRIPRRLTVTAVKVDVVNDPITAEQLQRRISSDQEIAPDQIVIQDVEGMDALGVTRTRSSARLSGRRLSAWTPNWLGDSNHHHQDLDGLERVEE